MASEPRLPLTSLPPNAERIAALRELFPEAFTEGKVDFDRLKQALGEAIQTDRERYGLTWAGKSEAIRVLQSLSVGTLKPDREQSVNFDTTENLIIEGDNLEVLKLLQKPYFGKVKMIYIDPPYNTGNEFIYPDNYREGLEEYLRYSGQLSAEGVATTSNKETDGRYHSNWLSMMYPRLFLAKNLLQEDGVIFISIDDHEVFDLRLLMNEIFGEENHVGTFVWQAKKGGGSDNKTAVVDHEYVVCYGRGERGGVARIQIEAEELNKEDNKGAYRRGRELNKWGANSRRQDRPTMFFAIPGPEDREVFPIRNDGSEGCWRWGKPKMLAACAGDEVEFEPRGDGTYIVYEKIRTVDPRLKPYRTWLPSVGSTADGTKTVRDLFDGVKAFDFAKPVVLLKHLITIGTIDDDDIVLDFFAGSATTAHAAMELNEEDGGNRKFVLVQLPEKTDIAEFPTIADITRERVRRVIKKLNEADAGKLDLESHPKQDRGFKAFHLAASNFKIWNGEEIEAGEDGIVRQLELFAENVLPDAKPEDILFEILLKAGYDLNVSREMIEIAGVPVYAIAGGTHLICLERQITKDALMGMIARKPTGVVCLDEAFHGDDALLTNALLQMQDAGIHFQTV